MKSHNATFMGRAELEALGVRCSGDDVRVHCSTVLLHAEKMRLGDHVRIDPFCVLSAGGGLSLGNHVHIAAHCALIGGGGIEVADFAGVSQGAKLLSASDDFGGVHLTGPTIPEEFRGVEQAPIRLGRHAIVGAGSIVLPGVTFGEGAIAGALSLIKTNLPAWTIWGGSPARQIGERKQDLIALEEALPKKN